MKRTRESSSGCSTPWVPLHRLGKAGEQSSVGSPAPVLGSPLRSRGQGFARARDRQHRQWPASRRSRSAPSRSPRARMPGRPRTRRRDGNRALRSPSPSAGSRLSQARGSTSDLTLCQSPSLAYQAHGSTSWVLPAAAHCRARDGPGWGWPLPARTGLSEQTRSKHGCGKV